MPAEPHSDETPAAASASLPEVARIAADLIRFDTSNYGGGNAKGEREAAEYVGAYLESLGLEPEYFEPIPRRTNVMARVPGRDPESRRSSCTATSTSCRRPPSRGRSIRSAGSSATACCGAAARWT